MSFFPVLCPIFPSVGLQVLQGAPGSSCIHVQGEGPGGPRPVAAFPPVPPRSSSGLQLRSLQGHLPAFRHTLLQLRETGRPLWPVVPVQPRGAHHFRYYSTTRWSKSGITPWAKVQTVSDAAWMVYIIYFPTWYLTDVVLCQILYPCKKCMLTSKYRYDGTGFKIHFIFVLNFHQRRNEVKRQYIILSLLKWALQCTFSWINVPILTTIV